MQISSPPSSLFTAALLILIRHLGLNSFAPPLLSCCLTFHFLVALSNVFVPLFLSSCLVVLVFSSLHPRPFVLRRRTEKIRESNLGGDGRRKENGRLDYFSLEGGRLDISVYFNIISNGVW